MIRKILILVLAINSIENIYSQSSSGVNTYLTGRFLGWTNTNGANPLFFRTNDINRMKINGNVSYGINGYTATTKNGYMLIGESNNSFLNTTTNIYTGINGANNAGAFSMLHLNGPVVGGSNQYQEYGYRPWMQTGVTFTGNRDFAYYGLRQVGTGADHTEAVFLWADNGAGGDQDGPDNMVFRFSSFLGNDGGSISTNLNSATDLDGLHVATFNPNGYFGLGNTFGMNSTGTPLLLYTRPQSLMHMSYDYQNTVASQPYGFMQITARRPLANSTNIIGQGETATDGLRMGIDYTMQGLTSAKNHLNGVLRWQEASSFIIQTPSPLFKEIPLIL